MALWVSRDPQSQTRQANGAGHPMALNLFSKTWLAHQQASPSSQDVPSFLICEHDERRAEAFMEDLRQTAGSELADRVGRVGNGRESVRDGPLQI